MTHLFKVTGTPLFVEKLDLLNQRIIYTVRDELGKLMNARKDEKFSISEGSIYFDLNRELPLPLAAVISETLG